MLLMDGLRVVEEHNTLCYCLLGACEQEVAYYFKDLVVC
jgi:hypothetical protein